MRTIIAIVGAALLALTLAACATWQPFYQPPVDVAPEAAPAPASIPTPAPFAAPSPSALPTPAAAHHREPSAPKAVTPALITDSFGGQDDAAAKSIEQVSTSIGRINRSRLSNADAESYDLAVNLLASARKSLANRQSEAATSLAHKASILVGEIPSQ